MADEHTCPKCQGRMEKGYVPDYGYRQALLPRWVSGDPEPGLFGLKGFFFSWGAKGIPVSTYRCAQCGYLEAYAGYA